MSYFHTSCKVIFETTDQFDHAIGQSIGLATGTRTVPNQNKMGDPAKGTNIPGIINRAKNADAAGTVLALEYYSYVDSFFTLIQSLEATAKGATDYASIILNTDPRLLQVRSLEHVIIDGLKAAACSCQEDVRTKFILRYGIVPKDTLLAKDVSLTVLSAQADGAYMQTVEFNSPEDALSTLEGGLETVEKQMAFLQSGLSELSNSSAGFSNYMQSNAYRGVEGFLHEMRNRIESTNLPTGQRRKLLQNLEILRLESNRLADASGNPAPLSREELTNIAISNIFQFNKTEGQHGSYHKRQKQIYAKHKPWTCVLRYVL